MPFTAKNRRWTMRSSTEGRFSEIFHHGSACKISIMSVATAIVLCLQTCCGHVDISSPSTRNTANTATDLLSPSTPLPSVSPLKRNLTLGVILPLEGQYPWTLRKTRTAIEYAMETVKSKTNLLPGWTIRAEFRDSKCSETDGPLEAIDMYTNKTAQVFFGPACDFAVAPIARFTKRWDVPVITAGALVRV